MKNFPTQKLLRYLAVATIASCFIIGCKKNDLQQSVDASKNNDLEVAQQIPPEILVSMYNDFISNHSIAKAQNLKLTYDFKTGKRISGRTLSPNVYVAGVGNVLDGGSFSEVQYSTQAHIEKLGWVTYSFNNMNLSSAPQAFDNTPPPTGDYMGTVGQSKRIEAFILPVIQYNLNGSHTNSMTFIYKAYMQANGWLSEVVSGQAAGITGQSLRMEAFQIRFSSNPQNAAFQPDTCLCLPHQVKLYYRAQVQGIGWQPWVSSGQTAGTTGQSLRCEAMQIRVYLLQ